MGKKLSDKENISNIDACVEYSKTYSAFGKKHVIAYREDDVIFLDLITVNISKANIYYNVNIMWDEKISEMKYKEIGLHGYYSTMYCCMEYKEGLLIIKSDNIRIEIHE